LSQNFWTADGSPGWSADGYSEWSADGFFLDVALISDARFIVALLARLFDVAYEPSQVIGPPVPMLEVTHVESQAAASVARNFIVSYVPAQALNLVAASREITRPADTPVDLRGRHFTVSYVPGDWDVTRPPF
jgi:hypothetical protein